MTIPRLACRTTGRGAARSSTAGPNPPPAIVMGGHMGSAISVARSLGRAGIDVYLLADPGSPERYSRYVTYVPLPVGQPAEHTWAEYLLGPRSDHLRGAVLLACSDLGIELLLKHRAQLSERFALDISNRVAQECALNKLLTYRRAAKAGIPAPQFWHVDTPRELEELRDEFVYPLILKPLYSHRFSAVYGKKFLVVHDFGQLHSAFKEVLGNGLEVVLLEMIPGPDDRLCSYYTYLDEQNVPQFDFTKRIIRRFPENEGLGCYHITDWNPEVADLGLRLLTHIGLQGLGNVEFKRDHRDGELKVIEINARFTAANALLAASGYDLGLYVYNRLTGRPQAPLKDTPYRTHLHLWYPENDAKAYAELHAQGKLSFGAWVTSLLHPQVLPYFRWYDPAPSAVAMLRLSRRLAAFARRRLQPSRLV